MFQVPFERSEIAFDLARQSVGDRASILVVPHALLTLPIVAQPATESE